MKTKILLLFLLGWMGGVFGQEKINSNKINVTSQFIFDDFTKGVECTKEGNIIPGGVAVPMPVDAIFTVVGKNETNDKYVVKFLRWKPNKSNISNNLEYYYKESSGIETLRNTYKKTFFDIGTGKIVGNDKAFTVNEKRNPNTTIIEVTERYFLVEKNDLLLNGAVYHAIPKYEFVFGTITYLARIRPGVKDISSNWSTDLNLGIAYGVRKNFNKNWGLAALGGFSVSKIKIDSLSTSPSIRRTIEKVSLSPTLNILANYKKFFVGFGIGIDWINLDSEESKKWVYNKKPFYAIGIGLNLFSAGNNDTPEVSNTQ